MATLFLSDWRWCWLRRIDEIFDIFRNISQKNFAICCFWNPVRKLGNRSINPRIVFKSAAFSPSDNSDQNWFPINFAHQGATRVTSTSIFICIGLAVVIVVQSTSTKFSGIINLKRVRITKRTFKELDKTFWWIQIFDTYPANKSSSISRKTTREGPISPEKPMQFQEL